MAPETPWLAELRANIELAANEREIDLASIAPDRRTASQSPGPSAEDIAAAQSMTSAEQSEMIRSMVARLAQTLEEDPDNAAGWARLGRAYVVLNEPEKAKSALARAVALDPANMGLVQSYADATLAAPDQIDPLPGESIGTMRELLNRDTKNRQALWYLGLAEAQDQNPKAAAELWGRLLVLLDPGTITYTTVQNQIQELTMSQ
jgi:cytochrome c-type biogenesis protein CcmH